ncbi:YitT family protein [Paenibacillus albiflavus]|uniref:YitT family protein n=1 Tax=Paenibacillus albiflavus TaxID=2545760 RepID=A0A4V2WP01_9BACL|nr:YitT family protein [Paenibacillus albiflavus]TCZ77472.1 YitT family protein [Paenibacillus albiflavus]
MSNQPEVQNHKNSLATTAKEVAVVFASALLMAIGIKWFLQPHHLLSGGAAGVSLIISYFSVVNLSFMYFAINLPILIWGYIKLGKRFVLYSVVSVVVTTIALELLPDLQITKDPLMAGVFGGILVAIAIGYSFKYNGSTGGFDIIGAIVTKSNDFPLGQVMMVMNSTIVIILAFMDNWDVALYSLVSIYIKGKVVDLIHVRHMKVTAFIITKKKDELTDALVTLPHGLTMIKTHGCYNHQDNYMLMTVTTRYELPALRNRVLDVDPAAFINVVDTSQVIGRFRRAT